MAQVTKDSLQKIDQKIAKHVMNLVDIEAEVPQYSADIAAAWEVVEELRSQLFFFSLGNASADTTLNRGNWATFAPDNKQRGSVRFTAQGKTMAEAICLAALKVVGEEL